MSCQAIAVALRALVNHVDVVRFGSQRRHATSQLANDSDSAPRPPNRIEPVTSENEVKYVTTKPARIVGCETVRLGNVLDANSSEDVARRRRTVPLSCDDGISIAKSAAASPRAVNPSGWACRSA
jgi:hypothetical protein